MFSSAVLVAVANPEDGPEVDRGWEGSPPALIPVLGRPIVAHAVRDLVELGVSRISVLVDSATEGTVSRALEGCVTDGAAVGLVCGNPDSVLTEMIGSARRMLDDGPFILRFADCIGRLDAGEQIRDLTVGEFDGVALMSRFDDTRDASDRIPARRPTALGEFHVGVFALGSGFPSALPGVGRKSSSLMESALDWMEGHGGRIDRRHVTGWWRRRDDRQGILSANRFALAGIGAEPLEARTIDSDVEGAVRAHPTSKIESSVIRGPVWIGAGARIADAFVGPFTAIGPGVSIDGAEIENSVVLEGSRISNIGGRLDSSVIGPHATVEKDFRIPRGTRLEVGQGANVMFG